MSNQRSRKTGQRTNIFSFGKNKNKQIKKAKQIDQNKDNTCVSCFSFAVIKYPEKKQVREKGIYLFGLCFQQDKICHGREGLATVRESMAEGTESWLTPFLSIYNKQRKREQELRQGPQ